MLKRTTLILCLFALLGPAHAQQDRPEATFPRYKWDLGTDLLFLVNRNAVPPSMFVRLNRDNFTAWRFRVGGSYTEHLDPPVIPNNVTATDLQKTVLTSFVSVGKEWQRQQGKFQLFYGSDIFADYTLTRHEGAILGGKDFFPKYKDLVLGISPLVGVKFFLHQRFSVSAESHLNLSYRRESIHHFRFNADSPDIGTEVTRIRKYFHTRFSPVHFFNIHYHF